MILLTGIYALYWSVGRGRPRSVPVLLTTDFAGSLAIGADNIFLMLGDLGTISGVFENLIGFICIPALPRADRAEHGPAHAAVRRAHVWPHNSRRGVGAASIR